MAFSAKDDFTGTGALAGTWTSLAGTASKVSGFFQPSSAPAAYRWNTGSPAALGSVQIVTGVTSTNVSGFLRFTAGFNGYLIVVTTTAVQISRSDAGVATVLESIVNTPTPGDAYTLTARGSNFRAYKNGVAIGSGASDATYSAAGFVGLTANTVTDTVDAWLADDGLLENLATVVGTSTTSANLHAKRSISTSAAGLATTTTTASKVTGTTNTANAAGQATTTTLATRLRNSTTLSAGVGSTAVNGIRWRNVALSSVSGSASVSLVVRAGLTTIANGVATTTTTASRLRALQLASVSGHATTQTSGIRWRNPVLSAISGNAHTTVSLNARRTISTTVNGIANTQVSIGAKRRITASSSGIASTTLQLLKVGSLVVNAIGRATITLTVSAVRSITTAPTGSSTTSVSAARKRGVSVSLSGLSTTIANINAIYGHDTASGQGLATVQAALTKLNNQSHIVSTANGTSTTTAQCGRLVISATVIGKYKPEHDSALADLLAARGFAVEHQSALSDLMEAGR